jgi:hypothetical protein
MMDDRDIVKTFLDMGIQITNEALPIIRKDPEFFVKEVKRLKIKPFFLTKEIVDEILARNKKGIEFQPVKEIVLNKRALRVDDYANYYLKKYERIKDIFISSGFSAISINKINENTKIFSTIGIIREKGGSSITIEDPTGGMQLLFEGIMKQRLQEFDVDDVVAVYCERVKDNFFVRKILHPDIPLNREVRKTDEEILLKVDASEENFLSPKKYSNPLFATISGISILILPKKFYDALGVEMSSEDLIKLLKKRFLLPKTFDIAIAEPDDFVFADIPDLIITDLQPETCKNYKGTTILSVDKKSYEVNFHTREVKEI